MESAKQDTGGTDRCVNANDAKVFKAHAAPFGLCDQCAQATDEPAERW